MYDLPEVSADHDALWRSISAQLSERGVPAPAALLRDVDVHDLWRRSDLLVAQTCGWPYVTELSDRLRVVGAFEYAVDGSHGPRYRSQLIARRDAGVTADDLGAGRLTIAVNSFDSLSGWVSLRGLLDATGGRWAGDVTLTGAHARSVEAVANGAADVALVDQVTLALLAAHRPTAVDLVEVIGQGPPIPCLPIVVRRAAGDELTSIARHAFAAAIADPELAA